MEVEAAKAIGAGIACFGMAGAALGLGNIFGSYLSGACATRRQQTASSAA
ncbi:F0F1 ATP synthase subunit C [Nitratireductor aquibiodomus RA22]|uniref:F0F1 ATP synthase subunit C n=1 Tax=Nitratireductor aquibiodomus RA22 TaxID=1189611 RepID=I5C8X0_9HYPH|nr:F0F1 ATP synthase subunit C [Nitratireductor aquibiodomus RA22]